jgi:Ca2+-transporting ATPase
VVFEAERSERGMMERPPRDPRARLFSARMLATSLLLGATLLAAVFAAYAWAVSSGLDDTHARAVGFAAIVFGNLGLIFVNRSHDRLVLETLREPNPALWWIVGGALAALAAAIYAPPLAAIFRFAPLGAAELTVAAAAGLAGVAWYELRKLAARRRR